MSDPARGISPWQEAETESHFISEENQVRMAETSEAVLPSTWRFPESQDNLLITIFIEHWQKKGLYNGFEHSVKTSVSVYVTTRL